MRLGVAAGVALAVAASAPAQNLGSLARTGSGARAAGMANAFVAVSDDGTASSWNPAGLAQLRRPEASLVVNTVKRSFDLSGFITPDNGARYTDRRDALSTSGMEFVSLAVPFSLAGKPVTLQGGWRRLYELRGQLRAEFAREPVVPGEGPPALQLRQDDDVDGDIDLWSAAAAVKLTPRAALGASLNLWRGDWAGSDLTFEQRAGEPQTRFELSRQATRMRGANLSAGLLLTYARLNVGLVWNLPFDSRFSSRLDVRGPEGLLDRLETDERARLAFGSSIGMGVAWRPRPRLTLALDLTWDEWSRAELRNYPRTTGPINFFDSLPQGITSTRDTLGLNFGLEHLVQRQGYIVPLRFGLAYEPQGFMDPILRDPVDYFMLAGGAGFNTNSFKFDAALQYRFARSRLSDALTLEGVPLVFPDAYGVLRTGEWRFKVSGIFRLADAGAVGRIFKKVFGGD